MTPEQVRASSQTIFLCRVVQTDMNGSFKTVDAEWRMCAAMERYAFKLAGGPSQEKMLPKLSEDSP